MYPYTEWEDFLAGMYRNTARHEEAQLIEDARALLADARKLRQKMVCVVNYWDKAAQVNLHDEPNNRAWLGHAACCYARGVPEHLTRAAWALLTDAQRVAANDSADQVIEAWRGNGAKTLFG